MRKIYFLLLGVLCLLGCQSGKPMKPDKYIFVDLTGTAKQVSMNSLNEDIVAIEDLCEYADTVMAAKIISIGEAENVNDERFRTPITIECLETILGEKSSMIYMDGGRMGLERYREEGIDDLIMKKAASVFTSEQRKQMYFTIVPLNFVDLEEDEIYLFFIKDEMIINGGYGVFKSQDDGTYQNMITDEKVTLQMLKEYWEAKR